MEDERQFAAFGASAQAHGRAAAVGALMLAVGACTAAESTASDPIAQAVVTPATFTMVVGDTLRFASQAFDGTGSPVTAVFSWGATGGTVSATGLFTAGPTTGAARGPCPS